MTDANDTPATMQGFQARWVFGSIPGEMRRRLVAFWMREGALTNPDEAWRRVGEVACILQNQTTGDIAGVCTVAIGLDDHGRSYGLLRIYVAAANRRPGLNVRMMRTVIAGFQAMAGEAGAPRRVLATIENQKIEGPGGRRLLHGLGFEAIGRTPGGELIIQRQLDV